MKSLTRGLSMALCGLALFGVTGCGPDNDTEAEKASKAAAGASGGAEVDTKAPPSSAEDYGKRQSEMQRNSMKQGGYPGAKKK